jgi:hypothetical protein
MNHDMSVFNRLLDPNFRDWSVGRNQWINIKMDGFNARTWHNVTCEFILQA